MVADIDQLILLLSIPGMWNLARNIMEFNFKFAFIIICLGPQNSQKKENNLQVVYTMQYQSIHRLLGRLIKSLIESDSSLNCSPPA